MKILQLFLVACFTSLAFAQQPDPSPTPDSYNEETRELSEEQKRGHHEEGEVRQMPAEKETAGTWDVNRPPGPSHEAKIDVTSGTWMSLDVSPGGDQIVFDLLGDIYVVPMSGGEAKALTSGLAWDEQPRYSPDGRFIAFTSDRAGGDNIWVMKRDGSDLAQVTKETFRLVNSPAWTPDGSFIAARKHFTSTRSAGAGEIWLYHRTGGEGLQMTVRPNEQKDLGEPAFSPDGRYLYYSQDTTPGTTFEYNRDPNTQIYVIQRLDRDTGEIVPFVTGPGGAVRPTPSRDGKQLAFVRRVRNKSVLHVADVASGAIRPIYEGLDRDMQETWAIHGVYPGMAWTPDDRAIVVWAGGKIRRIDVGTGTATEIPFRVRDSRTITEALRFRQDVAPERFPVRMIRWAEVSPRGDRVVFSAMGHIYVRDLPNGTPRRLTRQSDHFEFYPSFSRDGQSVVYTTWNDRTLGSVRIAPSRGGEGRVITRDPGHYVEPAFSPDGRQVIFRKVAGGYLRAPEWSRDPAIYITPASGGDARKVTADGFAPHFGAHNDRFYYMSLQPENRRALKSVDLSGADVRTHLVSEAATQFRVSPDGRWIALTEGFNAHIAPLVATGRTIDIGPQTKALPLRRVSRDAGDWIHWSGDSSTLHWSLGPELFSRRISEAFPFVEGAPEKLPEPPERGVHIGFEQIADVPSGATAFVGGRIITMRGDEVIADGTIVVDRNRITAVGPRDQVALPRGAHIVDSNGMTLMPGWIDVHWHGAMGTDEIIPQQSWINYSSLAFGVTTIHDPSNDTSEIFTASEMQRAGTIVGPRIYSTGTILYGAKATFRADIETLEDARSHLRRMKAVGAFSVKSYNQPRRDQRQQVVQAARELEMMVVPEGGSLFPHNMNMIADGHTGIEHSIPVARIYDDVIQFWSQSNTYYTPTLVVGYGGLWGENYWYQKTNVWENQRLMTFAPRDLIDARSRRRVMAPDDEFNHIENARVAKELNDAGVPVQIGAHGQRNGLDAHWETWMMAQGGMTPMAALRTATINSARYLGLDGDLGSIEAGKLADIIVMERNPLEDIRHTESIRYTMINGRLYNAATMSEIGNRPRPRGKFYWER
jgi:imidazolonepropionase-like amidohydrolase/Tol biopolymer transport system component